MREFFVYVLYRAGVALVSALPISLLFRAGQFLGTIVWMASPHFRWLARRNAAIAFAGEKSPREICRLVRRHFQRLGANLLCGIKCALMPLEQVQARVKIDNIEAIDAHLRQKRGVVLVVSHIGNWELISQALPKFIGHARNSSVYQALRNRRIDAHVRKLRGRAGVEMFERAAGFDDAIALLRGGGAIGILSDQHAGNQGLWTPFFHKIASTTPLPALLAKRTGAALVGVAVNTDGVARWKIDIQTIADSPNESIEALTASANETIEKQIRTTPEDWFWVHNRWKTPFPHFLLGRYKRGLYLPPHISTRDLKPFRILVRSSNWLGDAVMSVPTVRAIKRSRPDAHVTVCAPAKLAPLWKRIAEVDDVIAVPNKSLLGTVRKIDKQPRFDVAILLPNSLRSALEVWLADVPRRVGYAGHSRAWLLNQIVVERRRRGPPQHHARRYLHMVRKIGGRTRGWKRRFALPNESASSRRLALCPGAEYGPAKRWLPERFAEVAKSIVDLARVEWVLLGTDKDVDLGKQIAAAIGENCINRIGQTNLEELMAELQKCRLCLTNDTGTMHLAALFGVRVVAIFGSTEPALTKPLGRRHRIIRHHVECSPCFLRECPIDFRCMRAVEVTEVRNAIMSILRRDVVTSAA
jgi:heptosyltransferase II